MRVIVTDSNVLINLRHVDRLDLLGRIPAHEFVVPDHVREELTVPGSRERLADADKSVLEQHRFKMMFASFRDLVR